MDMPKKAKVKLNKAENKAHEMKGHAKQKLKDMRHGQ